jgi:hypothetical protein
MDRLYIAKLIAIPTPFLLSGYQLASSQNFLPSMLDQSASVTTPIFAKVYYNGLAILAGPMVIGSGAFGYLAYVSRNKSQRNLYAVAGALTIGIGVFTKVFMAGGIDRLIEISKDGVAQSEAQSRGEALRLLKTWTAQNWLRSGMGLVAGILGLVATLEA